MKNKQVRYRNVGLIILVLLVIMSGLGYVTYKEATKLLGAATSTPVVKDTFYIESQDFVLRDNATEFQETLFNELNAAIKSEDASTLDGAVENGLTADEYIAGLVVENYVADMYTWTNKAASYDVGGLTYIYSRDKVEVLYIARDGLYYNMAKYIEDYGSENLLEVASTTIEYVNPISGGYTTTEGVNYPCFDVKVTWSYKDTSFYKDYNDMETTAYAKVIINDDGRYEIIEVFGDR